MNNALKEMIDKYNPQNELQKENALKEICQEIALAGLAKSDFFTKVGFYGGTCARIFYNLDRFSEDLDFASTNKNEPIEISKYLPYIKNIFKSYDIDVDISIKNKESNIESAFIKANTKTMFLKFYPSNKDAKKIISNRNIKIKLEIDVENPDGWNIIIKQKRFPITYKITTYDKSTLFAGKIHALLCRNYKNRVKGRDFYDYLFYLQNNIKFNLKYLQNKLINSKITSKKLTLKQIKKLLLEKFITTNYKQATDDVKSFIENKEILNKWSKDFFISTLNSLDCK